MLRLLPSDPDLVPPFSLHKSILIYIFYFVNIINNSTQYLIKIFNVSRETLNKNTIIISFETQNYFPGNNLEV